MSDEIYEHLLYDGATTEERGQLQSGIRAHTIIVHGFAKAWSMTGWRLGFLAAPSPSPKPSTPSKAIAPATRPASPKKGPSPR
jgi:aspartate aminotransferase